MSPRLAVSRGLSCTRCGGILRAGVDPDLLRCSYCDTHHVFGAGDDVAAYAPVGRIGHRRARRVLLDALGARGIDRVKIADVRLAWIPFWHVRGKLVGWQVYQEVRSERPRNAEGDPVPVPPVRTRERREELVARDVDVTLPACDARKWGLIGVNDRLASLRLRPVAMDGADDDALVCSVVVPRAAAERHALELRRGGVVPRGAVGLRQRLSLTRLRLRLVYYPVWRLHFEAAGHPGLAHVDAIRARVIEGDVRRTRRSHAWAAWVAAGVAGWIAGLHPALGTFGLAAWWADRLRRHGPGSRAESLTGWVGRELSPVREERVELDDTGADGAGSTKGAST